jgi:AbiV family abortive infection protein
MDRESYNLCYQNGKKHIDLARRLGDDRDYGTAISFIVLGLEELIKYLVIKNALLNKKRFTDREINGLFSSHVEKHKIIVEFLESTKEDFAEKFILSLFNEMTNRPLTDDLKIVKKNRFREFGSMAGLTEKHLTENEINIFIHWVDKNADNLKNKGLYVDRESKSTHLEKSKLTSPNSVNENDFKLVLKFADSFLKQATFSKDLDLTDEEFEKLMNSEFGESQNL